MMQASELKTCPLCRSEFVSVAEKPVPKNEGPWQVECNNCDLILPLGWTREAIVERWNTRAPDEQAKAHWITEGTERAAVIAEQYADTANAVAEIRAAKGTGDEG